MTVVLKQFDNGEVNPVDDARLYNLIIADEGVVSGCTVTHLGTNQLQVAAGWGIIKGRIFTIAQETVNATVSDSGTKRGRLIVKIDMTNPTTPAVLDTQMAATLPALTQEDINAGGEDFELPLAEYDISPTLISNLESVANVITTAHKWKPIIEAEEYDWSGDPGDPKAIATTEHLGFSEALVQIRTGSTWVDSVQGEILLLLDENGDSNAASLIYADFAGDSIDGVINVYMNATGFNYFRSDNAAGTYFFVFVR